VEDRHQRADNDARNHAPAGAPSGHGEFAAEPHPPTRYERDQDDAEGNKHNAQHHSVLHVTYPWDWELAAGLPCLGTEKRWPVLVSTTVCALARLPPSRARAHRPSLHHGLHRIALHGPARKQLTGTRHFRTPVRAERSRS